MKIRKQRPYIRSNKRISDSESKPVQRVVVVTDHGIRQFTRSAINESDFDFVAERFLDTFRPKERIVI